MKISARNQLKEKIIRISEGSVNTGVVIELAPGVEITSIITKSSADSMGLVVDKEAFAVVKASNVIIGVDH